MVIIFVYRVKRSLISRNLLDEMDINNYSQLKQQQFLVFAVSYLCTRFVQ